jgi:hypothetical protein
VHSASAATKVFIDVMCIGLIFFIQNPYVWDLSSIY